MGKETRIRGVANSDVPKAGLLKFSQPWPLLSETSVKMAAHNVASPVPSKRDQSSTSTIVLEYFLP